MKVRKAVIPAAGLGTRMLPATKTVPKEMLPLVDKPAIQYLIEEAAAAGIEDILIVTNRAKSAMDDYFDYYPELETRLNQGGKDRELTEIRRVADLARCIDDEISIHDFRMVSGPSHTNVIFDVVVPYHFRLTDKAVEEKIKTAVRTLDGNYFAVICVERSYT